MIQHSILPLFWKRWNSKYILMKDGIVILHIHVYIVKHTEKDSCFAKRWGAWQCNFFHCALKNLKQLAGNIYKIYLRTTQIDCNSFIQYTITHRAIGNKNHLHLFHAVLGHIISFKFLDLFKLTSSTYGHNVAVHFLFSPMHLCLSLLY